MTTVYMNIVECLVQQLFSQINGVYLFYYFIIFSESYHLISDCLSSFTELEELEASELYMCSNCKKKQRSTKKFWIRRLPNVNSY